MTRIENVGEEIQALIRRMKLAWRPKRRSTASMKSHSKRSKALARSSLKEESLLGPSLKGEGVDNLLGNNYVGEDMPILNKGGLGLVNIIGEMRLQSIS